MKRGKRQIWTSRKKFKRSSSHLASTLDMVDTCLKCGRSLNHVSISQGAFVYKSRTKRGRRVRYFYQKLSKRLYLSFCVRGMEWMFQIWRATCLQLLKECSIRYNADRIKCSLINDKVKIKVKNNNATLRYWHLKTSIESCSKKNYDCDSQ